MQAYYVTFERMVLVVAENEKDALAAAEREVAAGNVIEDVQVEEAEGYAVEEVR